MGPPRAIFFDVGGTLLAARRSVGHVYGQVLASFGRSLDPLRLQELFEASWTAASRRVAPGADRFSSAPGGTLGFWRAFLDDNLRAAGAPPLLAEEFAAVLDAFGRADAYDLYPDTRPVLEAARQRGFVLGVISNWDERLPAILDLLGLSAYFAVALVSGVERCEKPAPEIFARACRRAGVRPEQALHVGDSPDDDYRGAREAGLEALLLDRRRATSGDHVIHDLATLLDRVGARA